MKAEDLLLSVSSLLHLQKVQAEMEGRDFCEEDALAAVRPALESVLDELLRLQDGPQKCPHCKRNMTVTESDLPLWGDEYETTDVQEIVDEIDAGGLDGPQLETLHKWEAAHQKRGSILSAISNAYGGALPADEEEAKEIAESRSRKLDNMFDDIFARKP